MTDAVEDAYAFLRGHTTAELRFDEHMRAIKYVIAPDGKLIAPVMVAMLQAVDTVLFVPENADGSMEVQVTLEPFEERGPLGGAADRWRIYHGEPPDVRWAMMTIEMARHGEFVIDGIALVRANPLAKDEGRICRDMNQNHADDLRLLCRHFSPTQMEIEKPLMVGIDPGGIDVRARFEVVRVPASEPMETSERVPQVLGAMLKRALSSNALTTEPRK